MVPFGFRILKAELGVYIKKSDESLSNLNNLLIQINKVLKEMQESNESEYLCIKFMIVILLSLCQFNRFISRIRSSRNME